MKKKGKIIIGSAILSLGLLSASTVQAGYWGNWHKTGVVSFIGGYVICNWAQNFYHDNGTKFYSVVKTTRGWLTCPNP